MDSLLVGLVACQELELATLIVSFEVKYRAYLTNKA